MNEEEYMMGAAMEQILKEMRERQEAHTRAMIEYWRKQRAWEARSLWQRVKDIFARRRKPVRPEGPFIAPPSHINCRCSVIPVDKEQRHEQSN